MRHNSDWLNFVSGAVDEVVVRIKLSRSPTEWLTLNNKSGFITVVSSTARDSEFVGCEVHISILQDDDCLAMVPLSRANRKLWRVLRWRFALEIALHNAEAVREQTSRLLKLTPRHLTVTANSTGHFYLLTRHGRICVRRVLQDGTASLFVEGMPPTHPLVMLRRGDILKVDISRDGFASYPEGSPEHHFVELLRETFFPATAAA